MRRTVGAAYTFALVMTLTTAISCTLPQHAAQRAEPPVRFAPLSGGSVRDCAPVLTAPDAMPCRVRWSVPAVVASAHAGGAWSVGDTLTFVARSADSVEFFGPISMPMARIDGTDLWVLSLRARGLDQALMGYRFLSREPLDAAPRRAWHGRASPPPAPRATALRGRVRTDSLEFTDAAGVARRRAVISYVPAGYVSAPDRAVVYMGDGGGVLRFAALLDTLITSGAMPPVAIVGVRSATSQPGNPESTYYRTREYVYGFQNDTAMYLAHERFFLERVVPWAEQTLGAPASRTRRIVWGASNSGAFAVSVTGRHPAVFGFALACSPTGIAVSASASGPAPSYFLTAGSFETDLVTKSRSAVRQLEAAGNPAIFMDYVGGHDDYAWEELFVSQIRWALRSIR